MHPSAYRFHFEMAPERVEARKRLLASQTPKLGGPVPEQLMVPPEVARSAAHMLASIKSAHKTTPPSLSLWRAIAVRVT